MDRIEGYAAAAFDLAQAEGELARLGEELLTIGRAVGTSKELRDALADPRLPADRKRAIFDELVKGRASELTTNFVSLVVGQGRAGDLPAIAERVIERAAASREKVAAEVRSAVPLDQATIERLTTALGKATGRRVEVRSVVDPSVLGGIVAQVGDTVIDGSVRRRLQSLRESLQTG